MPTLAALVVFIVIGLSVLRMRGSVMSDDSQTGGRDPAE